MSETGKEESQYGVTLTDMQRWFLNQQIIAVTPDSIYLSNRTVIKFKTLEATHTRLVGITQHVKEDKKKPVDRVIETTPSLMSDGTLKYQFVLYRGSRALVRIHMRWYPTPEQREDWRGVRAKKYNYSGSVDCSKRFVIERHSKTVTLMDLHRILTGAAFDKYDSEWGYMFTNGVRMKPFYGGDLSIEAVKKRAGFGVVDGIVSMGLVEEYRRCYWSANNDRFVTVSAGAQVLTRLRARPSREGQYVRWFVPCTFWLPAARLHAR